MNTPKIIALTGGIASGKSTLGAEFSALGVPVLDADQVARDVVEPDQPAWRAIVEYFEPLLGENLFLNNIKNNNLKNLNRIKLREYVFAHPTARQKLEQITHPAIFQAMAHWVQKQSAPYVILMTPLLSPILRQWAQRVLLVDVSETVQILRLCARDHIDESLAQAMLAAQPTRQDRLQYAQDVWLNEADSGMASRIAKQLHDLYSAWATVPNMPLPPQRLP